VSIWKPEEGMGPFFKLASFFLIYILYNLWHVSSLRILITGYCCSEFMCTALLEMVTLFN
jgi:hypothetical protein